MLSIKNTVKRSGFSRIHPAINYAPSPSFQGFYMLPKLPLYLLLLTASCQNVDQVDRIQYKGIHHSQNVSSVIERKRAFTRKVIPSDSSSPFVRSDENSIVFEKSSDATISKLKGLPDFTIVKVGKFGSPEYYSAMIVKGKLIYGTSVKDPSGIERFHTGIFAGTRFIPGIPVENHGKAGFTPGIWFSDRFVPGILTTKVFGAPIEGGFVPGILTSSANINALIQWLPSMGNADFAIFNPIAKIAFVPGMANSSGTFKAGNFRSVFAFDALKSSGLLSKQSGINPTHSPTWGLADRAATWGVVGGTLAVGGAVAAHFLTGGASTVLLGATTLNLSFTADLVGAGYFLGSGAAVIMNTFSPETSDKGDSAEKRKDMHVVIDAPPGSKVNVQVDNVNLTVTIAAAPSGGTTPASTPANSGGSEPAPQDWSGEPGQFSAELDDNGNLVQCVGNTCSTSQEISVPKSEKNDSPSGRPGAKPGGMPVDGPDGPPNEGTNIASLPQVLQDMIVLYLPAKKTFSAPINTVAFYAPDSPAGSGGTKNPIDRPSGTVDPVENSNTSGSNGAGNVIMHPPGVIDPVEDSGGGNGIHPIKLNPGTPIGTHPKRPLQKSK